MDFPTAAAFSPSVTAPPVHDHSHYRSPEQSELENFIDRHVGRDRQLTLRLAY
jgi:hypothetical protein